MDFEENGERTAADYSSTDLHDESHENGRQSPDIFLEVWIPS